MMAFMPLAAYCLMDWVNQAEKDGEPTIPVEVIREAEEAVELENDAALGRQVRARAAWAKLKEKA